MYTVSIADSGGGQVELNLRNSFRESAHIARIYSTADLTYTLGNEQAGDDEGFPILALTPTDIIAHGRGRMWINTQEAADVSIQFFGGNRSPIPPRVLGPHRMESLTTGQLFTLEPPQRATHIKMATHGTGSFRYTYGDGPNPSNTNLIGFEVTPTNCLIIPCYRTELKLLPSTSGTSTVNYQYMEDHREPLKVYRPVGQMLTGTGNSTTLIAVPDRARILHVQAEGSGAIYTLDGTDPGIGSPTVGLPINVGDPIDIPVAPLTVVQIRGFLTDSHWNAQFFTV